LKFTPNRLKTYLDIEATLDEATYAVTGLGLEGI